jgi:glycosyltransferase involved in cell wall biosynthesis
MSIIFVVDTKSSALNTAATARAKLVGGEVIACDDFPSSHLLLKFLIHKGGQTVIFSWRRALLEIASSIHGKTLLNELHSISSIGVLIPDHLGLIPNYWLQEFQILSMCDFYYVTNEILLSQYSELSPCFLPNGILHDLPNQKLINETKDNFPKVESEDLKIIWVGNSRWGERLGFKDHKGLETIVIPLKQMLKESSANVRISIFDSSRKYIPQRKLLQVIRESDLLVQTSESEGTGLPVLEAMGLETFVLTTPVGIATEISPSFEAKNIVERSCLDFYNAIRQLNFDEVERSRLREEYDYYVQQAEKEFISCPRKRELRFFSPFSSQAFFTNILLWKFRYLRKFLKWHG